jgi:hypothetical protein
VPDAVSTIHVSLLGKESSSRFSGARLLPTSNTNHNIETFVEMIFKRIHRIIQSTLAIRLRRIISMHYHACLDIHHHNSSASTSSVIAPLRSRPDNALPSLIPILAQIHPQFLQCPITMTDLVLCRTVHLRIRLSFPLNRRENRIPTEMARSSCRYDIPFCTSLE